MAAATVDQAALHSSPRSDQHLPGHYQQQQQQQQQQRSYEESSHYAPPHFSSNVKVDPAPMLPHQYTAPPQSTHESSHDGYLEPSVPGGYEGGRKLSIDTSLAKQPSYEPTSPSYYSLPPMESPTRRRRTDSMDPYAVNVGPFFKPTKQVYNLYSIDRARLYSLRINPKVDRGFFLADSDWTCYRRNYFQVSASFSACDAHGQEVELPCLMEMDNNLYTVTGFALGISARVGNGEKTIDLIQHTPKRDKGPQLVPQPRPVRAGGNPHQYNGIGTNNLVATFERLQFKTATANNGKRRAAQQYYVLNLDLYAQIDNGQQYKVAFIESAPLVVRGRSPGHYADGNLDALRVFPMDTYGRRSDYYASPMSPYMSSPMYSPVTPGSAMMSPNSPALPMPMSGHYSHSGSHATSVAMSAPVNSSSFHSAAHSASHYNSSGGPGRPPPGSTESWNSGIHPAWHRARADSLANSDCSYTTNNTTLTASSYNSLEFDDMDRGAAMGPRTRASISPVTPPGTTHPSPIGGSPIVGSRMAPIQSLHGPHHAPHHLSTSPKQRPYPHHYPSLPSWIDDNGPHGPRYPAHPGSPHPVTTPTTAGLSDMMVGFGFRGPKNEYQQEDVAGDSLR
ncbi:hypothetical protein HKX48_008027 [Thoreauomyces humboldtii]|nr:hypothetical protein HKX48_008027 [Thoreauomyces humboldtii]